MSFLNQSIILTKSFLLKFTQPISYSLYDIGNMIWVFKIKIQFEWNEAYVKALNSWHKIRNLAWSSFLKICAQVAQEKVWSFLQVIVVWWYFWRLCKGLKFSLAYQWQCHQHGLHLSSWCHHFWPSTCHLEPSLFFFRNWLEFDL